MSSHAIARWAILCPLKSAIFLGHGIFDWYCLSRFYIRNNAIIVITVTLYHSSHCVENHSLITFSLVDIFLSLVVETHLLLLYFDNLLFISLNI